MISMGDNVMLIQQNIETSSTESAVRRPWVEPNFVEMDLRTACGSVGIRGTDAASGG